MPQALTFQTRLFISCTYNMQEKWEKRKEKNGAPLLKAPLVVNICQQGFDFPAPITCKKNGKRGRKKKKRQKKKGKKAHSQEKVLTPFVLKACS